MRRLIFLLLATLVIPRSVSGQFTIPNNDQSGITGNPQAIWMKADIDALVQGIKGQGVVSGAAVTAQGSPNMTVAVAAGQVKVGGVFATVAGGNVTIPTAHATLPRVDLIVVSAAGTKSDVQGTAATDPAAPALTSTSVLLAMVYIPAADTTIATAQIVDKRVFLSPVDATGGQAFDIDVKAYGAVCDNSTDDLTALRAAFAAAAALTNQAANVRLPSGTCVFSDTITIGTVQSPYNHINVIGQGEDSSLLKYTGSTDGRPAILLNHNSYFHWENFALTRSGARGTSKGILVGATSGSGTQSTGGTFEHLSVSGFSINMLVGADGTYSVGEASEMLFVAMRFGTADYCWTSAGYNALNFVFESSDFSECSTAAISLGDFASDRVVVHGGAYANNECDFRASNTFSPTIIDGIRSEGADKAFCGDGWNRLAVRSSVFNGPSGDGDDTLVNIRVNNEAVFDSVSIDGKLKVYAPLDYKAALTIINSHVKTGETGLPVLWGTGANASGGLLHFSNNRVYDVNDVGAKFQDLEAQTLLDPRGGATQVQLVPLTVASAVVVDTPANGLNLKRVQSLAYGSAAVTGKNLRDTATFATSATVAFTFVRTVSVTTVANSPNISFTSGAIRAADIGKRISIPSVNQYECASAHAFVGSILALTDATHAVVAGSQNTCTADSSVHNAVITAASTQTATIGENEPDANYMLALGCDANETIRWSSKATTGFTLTSSNASSTATCDVIVIR